MAKIFLKVTAEHDESGFVRPLSLLWPDGRRHDIDRVLDVRQAASMKAGGQGMRYTCRVEGKVLLLFCDEGRWFVEG